MATASGGATTTASPSPWVVVDGREWIVYQADPGAAALLGSQVRLTIRPDRVHVIAS